MVAKTLFILFLLHMCGLLKDAADADTGGECYEIALLRDGERSRNIRTCVDRRHSRRRLVYVSVTPSVEIVLLRRSFDLLHGTFVLHYNGALKK